MMVPKRMPICGRSSRREFRRPFATRPYVAPILAAAVVLGGCAKLRETYYVGVYDEQSRSLQFYRFVLRGDSFLSKTKFASGWYPAAAVDAIAGEAMDEALKYQPGEPGTPPQVKDATRYIVAGPEGRRDPDYDGDRRLAIVMTGDIKAFTSAIQALADSEAMKKRLDSFAKKQQAQKDAESGVLNAITNDALKSKHPFLGEILKGK